MNHRQQQQIIFQKIIDRNNPPYWIYLVFAVLLGLLGVWINGAYLMDDALITLRYSYNFAHHGMPFWNQADIGKPSMGYTSILWMALNTVPALLTNQKDFLIFVAQVLAFLCFFIVIAVISWEIYLLRISPVWKTIALVVIFTQFGYGFHVNSAMETMLFSCIVLLAVRAYANERFKWSYFWGSLAFLTRPEGALLVGFFYLLDIINGRFFQAMKGGAVFLILLVGTLFLLHHWYGDFLPNTFYAKQELFNNQALIRTLFFLLTLLLPFLIMSVYATFVLRNKLSAHTFYGSMVFLAYYLSVDPLMNVLSRYQIPVLVLLTYGSLPVLVLLVSNSRKYKYAITGLALTFAVLNIGNGLGANYFANATGHAENNIIIIGKRMGEYRDLNQWLIYHDAGAVCYFSDWNTYETIGLTNGELARGQIKLRDIYAKPNALIVLKNFDLMSESQQKEKIQYTKMLSGYGYQYVQDIPVLFVTGQRDFVVAVYARDVGLANAIFQEVHLTAPQKPSLSFSLYRLAKRIVRGQ